MIEATFSRGEKVRAIVLDEPVNGISGIVECQNCDWRAVILSSDTDGQTKEIEEFAKTHSCGAKRNLRYRGGR